MLVYGIKRLIVVVDCFRFLQIGRLASGPQPDQIYRRQI